MNPPCSKWEIWRGEEIEGTASLGESTLFIRKLDASPDDIPEKLIATMTKDGKVRRVWFCKEFTNWPLLRFLAKHFDKVCLEASTRTYDNVPRDIKMEYTIYFKLNFPLKNGDFICVGPAFSDEAFEIGKGAKVNPEQYLKDTKIK